MVFFVVLMYVNGSWISTHVLKENKGIVEVVVMYLHRYSRTVVVLLAACIFSLANNCLGEEKKDAPAKAKRPPLLVTTIEVTEGAIQAISDFVGTTYFARVSEVAADLEGLVTKVSFDEGDRIAKGDELVQLDTQILEAEIAAAKAAYEQNLVDLENAERDFERIEGLHRSGSVSETDYDSYRAKKLRLEKHSAMLEAEHNRLLIAKNKKSIRAPFAGIAVLQPVEVGEWVAKGGRVAVIADDSQIEVKVEVPMEILENLEKGREVPIRIGSREYTGVFTSFIARGDVTTRTFTAMFSMENPNNIVEGLETLISLPKGSEATGLLVPRDAVVDKYGKTMVYRVVDGKAVEVPVQVAGYVGLQAVVIGEGLTAGQEIVVRGSKRVEDGLPLQFR
jgi:RND family efflux transporter MFP subunit